MERDLLGKVIEAEREILTKIESAKKSCDERIEKARREAEEKVLQEEAVLRGQCERLVREAEESAGERAAEIIEAAARKSERLKKLPDDSLQRIIMKYIGRILPGERDDSPHVKD